MPKQPGSTDPTGAAVPVKAHFQKPRGCPAGLRVPALALMWPHANTRNPATLGGARAASGDAQLAGGSWEPYGQLDTIHSFCAFPPTAIMQTTARKNAWPLDKMCLTVDVTKKNKEDYGHPPREGACLHGLFMEGRPPRSAGKAMQGRRGLCFSLKSVFALCLLFLSICSH